MKITYQGAVILLAGLWIKFDMVPSPLITKVAQAFCIDRDNVLLDVYAEREALREAVR